MKKQIKKTVAFLMALVMSFSVIAYTGNSFTTVNAATKTMISIKKSPNIKANRIKSTSVKLKWSKVKGATSYKVYRSINKKKWKCIKTTKNTSLTVKKLKSNKKYYFKVRAYKKKLKSPYSKIVTVKTKNTAVQNQNVSKNPDQTTFVTDKSLQEAIQSLVSSYGYTDEVICIIPTEQDVSLADTTQITDMNENAKPVQLLVNSYGYGDGVIYIEVDPSNWDGNFVAARKKITIKVNGDPLTKRATCFVPSERNGGSYEIKIELPSQQIEPGSVIDFTIPTGIVRNESGTQYNLSYNASVPV